MHHVEKLCNILYVLLFGILLIVVMGFYVYVVFSHGMDPSNICSIVYYIHYEKEENIERRMVFGALVYCIWGVFGVFDRVFLFV